MSPNTEGYTAATFIETYTGRKFFPLEPDPAAISIIDIAHALSMQCRYGGHVEAFYSTAQHCCLLAEYAAQRLSGTALDCLQVLMHDAAECYLVDIPRPVKQYMPEYRAWDHGINDAVRTWLSVSDIPPPSYLNEIDNRIIGDERAQLKTPTSHDWGKHQPLGITIKPWTPAWAKKQFLMRYEYYARAVFGAPQYIDESWGGAASILVVPASSDSATIEDVCEVDLRGGVGRVKLRDPSGHLIRDPEAGEWPRPKWRWVHGKFSLTEAKQ